jgi:hypothetical protein
MGGVRDQCARTDQNLLLDSRSHDLLLSYKAKGGAYDW